MAQPLSVARPGRPRTFWERGVVDPVLAQLTQGITPEKIALTLAVGTACAVFPLFGTATLLCLVVGVALRLNQPLIQMVNALCTIPHLFAVYGLIRLGEFLCGSPPLRLSLKEFLFRAPHTHLRLWVVLHQVWSQHGLIVHRIELTALEAVIAWLLVSPFWILALYHLTLPVLRKALARRGGCPINLPNGNPRPPEGTGADT